MHSIVTRKMKSGIIPLNLTSPRIHYRPYRDRLGEAAPNECQRSVYTVSQKSPTFDLL